MYFVNELFVYSLLKNPFELTLLAVIAIPTSRTKESGVVAEYALYCIPQ